MPDRHPTTRRIIAAGLRLFAEAGIAGTPIVKIEEAAGLARGSGAFYRHFKSKDELLEASIEDALAGSLSGMGILEQLADLPLEQQLSLWGHGHLWYFDQHRDLVLTLTRDAGKRPANYSHEPGGWPGTSMAEVAAWLRARSASGELVVEDPEATAVVLMDALTNYWLQREAESPTPYGVDEGRFVAAWTSLVLGMRPPAD